jgi:hypothetical protein
MAGDLARGVETVVADHVVSHLWEHTYLLWFDDQLTPHLRRSKPPIAAELARAKWGIGGQERPKARFTSRCSRRSGAQALIFGRRPKYISPRLTLHELADLGAKDGMLLDGGDSSSIAIGKGALAGRAGLLYGGWRPVATFFGVRHNGCRANPHEWDP